MYIVASKYHTPTNTKDNILYFENTTDNILYCENTTDNILNGHVIGEGKERFAAQTPRAS